VRDSSGNDAALNAVSARGLGRPEEATKHDRTNK